MRRGASRRQTDCAQRHGTGPTRSLARRDILPYCTRRRRASLKSADMFLMKSRPYTEVDASTTAGDTVHGGGAQAIGTRASTRMRRQDTDTDEAYEILYTEEVSTTVRLRRPAKLTRYCPRRSSAHGRGGSASRRSPAFDSSRHGDTGHERGADRARSIGTGEILYIGRMSTCADCCSRIRSPGDDYARAFLIPAGAVIPRSRSPGELGLLKMLA